MTATIVSLDAGLRSLVPYRGTYLCHVRIRSTYALFSVPQLGNAQVVVNN